MVEANNTQDREARGEATEHSAMKKQKKETVDANAQRTLCSHQELVRVNKRLRRLNDAINISFQKKTKMQKRKALQNKLKSLPAPALPFEEVPLDVVEDCKEPTTEDIDGMLEAVFNHTRPSTE